MTLINFSKMHGLGNDFIVIETLSQFFEPTASILQAWADRHCGIGFDQCLLISAPSDKHADFDYRIFNADGSEVAQCGNGARCVAKFIAEKRLSKKLLITLKTHAGLMRVSRQDDDSYRVALAMPIIENRGRYCHIDVGNPHAIFNVTAVDAVDLQQLKSQLISDYTNDVNVSAFEIISPQHIRIRTLERGSGETQACGSGAISAGIVAINFFDCQSPIQVQMPGGSLQINWTGESLSMQGPAAMVYDGQITA